MRMLLNIVIPHDEFNDAVRDGTVGDKIGRILEEAKPEAVYFVEQDGARGCIMIVNVDDAAQVPALAEPWFLTFGAFVEFRICMTPDDLQRAGLDEIGARW